jgi:hypothetical protein
VLAVDRRDRPMGIAYGRERVERVKATGITEPMLMLRVVLDGTARQLGGEVSDLELLIAACEIAKGEGRGDDAADEEPS